MSLLWNDPQIKKTIELMDPKTRYKYHQMGQHLYKNDYCDPKSMYIEIAAQIDLMLRDGLDPNDLTEEERTVFIEEFGLKSLDKYKKR